MKQRWTIIFSVGAVLMALATPARAALVFESATLGPLPAATVSSNCPSSARTKTRTTPTGVSIRVRTPAAVTVSCTAASKSATRVTRMGSAPVPWRAPLLRVKAVAVRVAARARAAMVQVVQAQAARPLRAAWPLRGARAAVAPLGAAPTQTKTVAVDVV